MRIVKALGISVAAISTATIAFFGYVAYITGETPLASTNERTEAGAKAECIKYLKRYANDPDSVEEVDADSWLVYTSLNTFTVHMLFRARNGFGAKILGGAICSAQWSPGDSWNVSMTEKKY